MTQIADACRARRRTTARSAREISWLVTPLFLFSLLGVGAWLAYTAIAPSAAPLGQAPIAAPVAADDLAATPDTAATAGAPAGDPVALSAAARAALVAHGSDTFERMGCDDCHELDGTASVGPSLGGIYGASHEMADGAAVRVDEAYLRQSIVDPAARVRGGFDADMPTYGDILTARDVDGLVAFLAQAALAPE